MSLVATFIDSQTMNLIAEKADASSGGCPCHIKNASLVLPCPSTANDVQLGLRPEYLLLDDSATWRGKVSLVAPTGADTYVVVQTDAGAVTVRTSPQTAARPGDHVGLAVDSAHVSWVDATGERVAA